MPMKRFLSTAVLALSLSGCALMETRATKAPGYTPSYAPKPLYRDPVYDGAADASIVFNKATQQWDMFYTNRRATLKTPDKDVSWVHGTALGVASSTDGVTWTYKGTANIPVTCTGDTLWAPEVYAENGVYHMWLTVVPGVFKDWKGERFIVHLTSTDLKAWDCSDRLDLGSDRVIDASVIKHNGVYRLWFKDERQGSRLFVAESPDLKTWTRQAKPVVDIAAEGPKVFQLGGYYWMVADAWKGLIVQRSTDLVNWELQPTRLLEMPGTAPTDDNKGQHPDVVVNNGRALIYYFVHQHNAPKAKSDPSWGQRTAIQVNELKLTKEGWLSVDRNAPVDARLKTP